MKISELIEKLQEKKKEHGDVECTAWQHEEEEERSMKVSSLYFSEDSNTLHIS